MTARSLDPLRARLPHGLASHGAAALLLALVASGCGSSQPGPSGSALTGCAAMASSCLVNQMGCVEEGGVAACRPCADGQGVDPAGACVALAGTAMTHDFAMFTTQPGEEVLGLCQSWTLDNPTELWITAVELHQDEASHHSNWTFVPDDKFDGPDGVWSCGERKYDQLTAALAGGVLYAQSTQAAHEVQRFPNGAAVRIPPYSRIIGDVHLLNASTRAVSGHARLGLYALAAADVKVKLTPFHLTFDALAIPPHAVSRHYADCDVGSAYLGATGQPWDLQVYYLLPHTHARATRFFVDGRGGAMDGKPLIDVGAFNGEARGRAYDPPIDMRGADGFRFGCEWNNTTDAEINWGFGDQEMCETLGFGATNRAFESSVTQVEPAGTDGTVQLVTGGCANVLFQWTDRPGGPGPKP